MKLFTKFFRFILLIYYLSTLGETNCIPEPTSTFVNDFASLLTIQEKENLEKKLRLLNDSQKIQIVVITTSNLCNMEISMYANEIGERWGVGYEGLDNGVVIVIKPMHQGKKGAIFIAPGRGIQGQLPDAIVKRLIEQVIIPEFKKGEYYSGINKAVIAIVNKLSKEEVSIEQEKKSIGIFELVLLGFVGFILGIFFGGGKRPVIRIIKLVLLFIINVLSGYLFLKGFGMEHIHWSTLLFSTVVMSIGSSLALLLSRSGFLKDSKHSNGEIPRTQPLSHFWEEKKEETDNIEFGGGRFNGGGAGGTW